MKTRTIYFDHQGILTNDERVTNIFLIIFGSLLIAVLAQISIPLPFSPVPITGQTVGVILVGGLLGANRGALSILCYIFEGAIGFPVFAQMKAGVHILIGPTAGYLYGFIFAAFLMGYLSEKGFILRLHLCFLSCLLATALILAVGTIYLALFTVNFDAAFVMGFYPFIIGGILKSIICAMILIGIRKF